MGKAVTSIVSVVKAIFVELHNLVLTILEWLHLYTKAALSVVWKVALGLLIADILLKTKFGVFQALLDVIKAFGGITVGGGITLAIVAVVVTVVIVVIEQNRRK